MSKYLTGIINDPSVIYAVNGGMEDWAYGASWLAEGKVMGHGLWSHGSWIDNAYGHHPWG